jgi:hypothetical protein
LVVTTSVLAQQPPPVEEPPKIQKIQAVERGFFLETDAGISWIVNKLTTTDAMGHGTDHAFGISFLGGAFVGYDILPVLSLAVGAYAMGATVSRDTTITGAPQGDLYFIIPMAQLQFALVTTERNFLYVRGGGGFAFGLPNQISYNNMNVDYGGNGPAFAGTIGFERYTKLRHFSIGAQAGAIVVTKPAVGIGVSVTPTLKYTF